MSQKADIYKIVFYLQGTRMNYPPPKVYHSKKEFERWYWYHEKKEKRFWRGLH